MCVCVHGGRKSISFVVFASRDKQSNAVLESVMRFYESAVAWSGPCKSDTSGGNGCPQGGMMAGLSSRQAAPATKSFRSERAVVKLRETAPYLSFITHITDMLMEVLLRGRIAMLRMQGVRRQSYWR